MNTHCLLRGIWLGLVLATLGASIISAGQFAGGDGTASSPYQIASPEQWVALSADPNLWDQHFVLIRDLDMVGVEPNAVQPIGEAGPAPFVGVLDGRGHAVAHLHIVRPDWGSVGAFGQIGQGVAEPPERIEGHVRNLHLRDVHIQGAGVVGGLAGELSAGTIRNCSVTGIIAGGEGIGGLVGWADGTIRDCTVTVQVRGTQATGGLAGRASGAIDSCTATVEVHGTDLVGGLVGDMGFGQGVSRCSSSGRVYGRQGVGGLAGLWVGHMFTGGVDRSSANPGESQLSRIMQCCSDCSVYGTEEVAGLIAVGYGIGEIQDCYALGPVAGSTTVGGLIGRRVGCCVVRCFAAGPVKGTADVGGLIGKSEPVRDANGLEDYPPCQRIVEKVHPSRPGAEPRSRLIYRPAVLACFLDAQASGVDQPAGSGDDGAGITALATDQMRQVAPFRDQGWDFGNIWVMRPGQPYPRLRWEPTP